MRITKKIFHDLAIYMVLLGIAIGILFPFFCVALGVPEQIAMTPLFFTACILAGITLAMLNITLARKTVGSRIRHMSQSMKHVETILSNRKKGNDEEDCNPETCFIQVDSEDELGESADSFNSLVMTLSELLDLNSELQLFAEMLTSHLELDALSAEGLKQLIKNSGAFGGAILSEKKGGLVVEAAVSINDPASLENHERLLTTMRTHQRQLIPCSDDRSIDWITEDFRPNELLIEPILHKQTLIGVMLLASSVPFTDQTLLKLKLFNQTLSLAFNNAITHEQMTRLAAIDVLTGLYNRRFGTLRLREEFSRAMRAGTSLSLLMMDIDHFKTINDTHGHSVGDKVLDNVARMALGSIREGDILMRYGGEEFICVLPGTNQENAAMVAERLRAVVMNSHVENADQEIRVTISVGIATYPRENILSSDQLIHLADEAMYTAKKTGRNRVVVC